jgi:small GTP-binding protein
MLRLAFHPTAPILATPEKKTIRIWELDFDTLLKADPSTSAVHYTTAKIALVGDSSVGKTGLGYRLAEDRFQVTESTHGQQFWVVDKLGKTRGDGTQCEAVLWDFAGQPNFRPIHSLFLDDVDLALVLFDPARPDTLAGVDYWLKQLSHNQQQYRTVLVAARTDVSPLSTSPLEFEAYCREQNISGGFVATSAKLNEGIDTLLKIVRTQID